VLLSDRDMVKCAQSGFDEFVSKPLTIEKLLERLRKINNDPANNRCLDP
jgi:DNA-binding response OmpR family regulator